MIVRDRLHAEAVDTTGLADFGDVPYLEALDAFIYALNHEAGLDAAGEARAARMLTGILAKRLRLVADRAARPEIASQVVRDPIFIVGQPRSGSTHLHALMGCIDGVRAPRSWEMNAPCPPPEAQTYTTDARIAVAEAAVAAIPAELKVRHPVSATRPEQCNGLMDWSFFNQGWMAQFNVPTYRDWYLQADYAPAYEAHYRTLQHLQSCHQGRWVLKLPKHLLSLDALLARYPDASLVWTYRDPAKVVPSVVSLSGFLREQTASDYDPVLFAREWVTVEELTLHRGLATRDRDADPARHIDLGYRSLMGDPVGTVAGVCEQAGLSFSDDSRRAVQQWLDAHPQTQHGVHRYSVEELGLDDDRLKAQFAFYSRRFDEDA